MGNLQRNLERKISLFLIKTYRKTSDEEGSKYLSIDAYIKLDHIVVERWLSG